MKNGCVLKLPFYLGDKVWTIYNNQVVFGTPIEIYIDSHGVLYDLEVTVQYDNTLGYEHYIAELYDANKIYNTKKEAKQALREARNG